MKFTRSLPAKAMARANVPISTITFSTLTFSAWSACITTVKTPSEPRMITAVWEFIHAFTAGVINAILDTPFSSRK